MSTATPTADTTIEATAIPNDWLAQDSISTIEFCPVQHQPNTDFLAAAAWDGSVRIFRITWTPAAMRGLAPTITNAEPWHLYNHQGPALSLAWSFDGMYLFSGGADKVAMMCNLQAKTQNQVAQHNGPISALAATPPSWGRQMLVTGSWDKDDKNLKYWDCSSPQPMATVPVPERVYSMDVTTDYLAVALADRFLCVYHRDKPTELVIPDSKDRSQPMRTNLAAQTRVVKCFPLPQAGNPAEEPGCAVGSIEGRASIQYFRQPARDDAQRNITYKCHRHDIDPDQAKRLVSQADKKKIQQKVYAVNDVAFNMKCTYASAGSDGTVAFWDKDNKQRLKEIVAINMNGSRLQGNITSCTFNPSVTIFAFAFSYDWSEGWVGNLESRPIALGLYALKSADTDPKKK